MSPSGAEIIRQIKSQIDEVDPSEVKPHLGNGMVLLDVRESEEWDAGHIPGAKHVPRGYLESRVEGVVGSDRSRRVVIYCASGQRSALAANTLKQLLGYAGVGTLGVVDDDEVDLSNLQRQVIHTTDRIGTPKVDSAEIAINGINPDVNVVKYRTRLDASNIMEIIEGYDVIVDGVDNFPTRYLLNDASVRLGIPVVSASILGFDGQLAVFAPYEGPCYRCLYPTPPPAELAPSCGANGVLGVLPGTMGMLQAVEVVELVTGAGEPLVGRLLLYEALSTSFTELKVRRDPECPICSRDPDDISEEEMGVFPDYEAFCAGAG